MNTTLNVCEMFHSIQGEGSTAGANRFFLRLNMCNLNCEFCDSKYHKENPKAITLGNIYNEYKKYETNGIVITGGEPLLQMDSIYKLLYEIHFENVEIETNGTIKPSEDLLYALSVLEYCFNISPKLENSGNTKENRFKPEVLEYFINRTNCIFKFVVEDEGDVLEVNTIVDRCKILPNQVYLMCKGATKQEQEKNQQNIINLSLKYGYNFSPRLHILIWDSKRGV